LRQNAEPLLTENTVPIKERPTSGSNTIGTSQVGTLREPSVASVRRAASMPTFSGSSRRARKRSAVHQ
jgi:hypothetical protein